MESRGNSGASQGFYTGGNQTSFVGVDNSAHGTHGYSDSKAVEWEASEYIHHEKGVGWVISLVFVAAALVALAIIFAQWTFAIVLVVMAVAFGYYALRRPKTVHYRLNSHALNVDGKEFPLTNFRAFGVVEEGAFHSIQLIPSKRFGFAVVLYVSEDEGEEVVDLLGSQLPMLKIEPDPFDALMRKLRF